MQWNHLWNRCQEAVAFRNTKDCDCIVYVTSCCFLVVANLYPDKRMRYIFKDAQIKKVKSEASETTDKAVEDDSCSLTLTTSPPSTFISWRRFCCSRLVLERHFSRPRRSTGKKKNNTNKPISHYRKTQRWVPILPMVIQCEERWRGSEKCQLMLNIWI